MKKKLIALTLALVLALSLAGCDILDSLTGAIADRVMGTWECAVSVDAELVEEILTDLDFYAEEIALFDLNGMACTKVVEFNEDKSYAFYYNIAQSREQVRQYFNTCIEALHTGRASLTAIYGEEITAMTLEEFKQFYADLYELTDYEALLQMYVDNSLDFEGMSDPFETGTYTVGTELIMCTETGTEEALGMEYKREGDKLTLIYIDGTEVYTKG